MKKRLAGACAAVAVALFPLANALAHSDRGLGKGRAFNYGVSHVPLISVDGMHAVDFANCASGFGNNGTSYCPNLAALAQHGVNYVDTSTSKPSDSFPGLMALVTGGSPRTVRAYYDVAYDRVLAPPAQTTGNGVQAGLWRAESRIARRAVAGNRGALAILITMAPFAAEDAANGDIGGGAR